MAKTVSVDGVTLTLAQLATAIGVTIGVGTAFGVITTKVEALTKKSDDQELALSEAKKQTEDLKETYLKDLSMLQGDIREIKLILKRGKNGN